MGLPLCRDPPTEPRETERDPTASARSHIRRRLHRRRPGVPSEVLRRSRLLDQDRRSSQQVLLDLLQVTREPPSWSSSASNGGLSSAATTASSAGTASARASAPEPQPWYMRDDQYRPLAYGETSGDGYNMPPSFLSPGLRVIRHTPATEPIIVPLQTPEQEMADFERMLERNRARYASPPVSRPAVSGEALWRLSSDREEEDQRRTEDSRHLRRVALLMESMAEHMREMNTTVPDVTGVSESGRRRGSLIDGLGDRERSLSPDQTDRSPWNFFSSPFPDFSAAESLDLATHCDFMSDGDSDAEEQEEPRERGAPSSLRWREFLERGRAEIALERYRANRAFLQSYPSGLGELARAYAPLARAGAGAGTGAAAAAGESTAAGSGSGSGGGSRELDVMW